MTCCRKGPNWGEKETRVFLELCLENQILHLMDGRKHKHVDIFRSLVPEMEKRGFFKTAEQMKLKLRNLKQNYFKCKRDNSVSGAKKNECPFNEELDLLYGGRPNVQAISQDGIDTALIEDFSESTVEIDESQNDFYEEVDTEITEKDDTTNDSYVSDKNENKDNYETPKKRNRRGNVEFSGRKSYETLLNSYCDKLLQGQSTLLQNVMEQQINSQSEMFHREMEMQRNWEQSMLEREMEFQREQTAAMIQSFNESIRSLRPVGPTYTSLKLIPMKRPEAPSNQNEK